MIQVRNFGRDTELRSSLPFGFFVGGRALCSDGKIRTLKRIAETADTFFSVPAAVTVKGKTVSGFVSVDSIADLEGLPVPGRPAVVRFIAVSYGRNAQALPEGAYQEA